MDKILYINSVFLALTGMGIVGIFTHIYKLLKKHTQKKEDRFLQIENDTNLLKENMIAILRDRLYSNCKRCIECGYITVYEFENITSLYLEYKKLGGNSFITELYEKVTKLKIVKGGL